MRYLTVALTRGRLASKTMELSEGAGITCEEMEDKGSRKLIFINGELGVRFFLTKANDVPTYMEYGVAGIGTSGKGTILEGGRKLHEVLGLGFGKCRICVCRPESARELLRHHKMVWVTMRYPGITRDYFYNKRYQTVEIIKLNDSTELAPIMGSSEAITDVVGIDSTLRENRLTVLGEICDSSARMTVNQASMKREDKQITKLIHDLREVLAEEDAGR